MRKLEFKWLKDKRWWHINEYGHPVVNEDAPDEIKDSYRKYIEQCKLDDEKPYDKMD